MNGREQDEQPRKWLLAVALLAGGTGICLGSALTAVVVGATIAPLVWVMVIGRVLGTAGVVFAWSRLEARPAVVRVFGGRVRRAIGRPGTTGVPNSAAVAFGGWVRRTIGSRGRLLAGGLAGDPSGRTGRQRDERSARVRSRSDGPRKGLERKRSRNRVVGGSGRRTGRDRTPREAFVERVRTLLSRAPVRRV